MEIECILKGARGFEIKDFAVVKDKGLVFAT